MTLSRTNVDNLRELDSWVQKTDYPTFASVALEPTAAPTHLEGKMFWDEDDHTLSLMSEISGSILQVGQENWLRIVNKTGSTITNGQVVYVSGAQGNRPTASLAIATSTNSEGTIGVATSSIANNAEGYITTFGIVRGVNTTGFTAGDSLWLSPSTAGLFTNVKPSAPNYTVRVGYALNSTVNGSILVSVSVDGAKLNKEQNWSAVQGFGVTPTAGLGRLQLPVGTTIADGMRFGDITVYRISASVLRHDHGDATANLEINNNNAGGGFSSIRVYHSSPSLLTANMVMYGLASTAGTEAAGFGTDSNHGLQIRTSGVGRIKIGSAGELHFTGGTPVAKPTVSGSRGGNAALASLLTALSNLGLVTDSTTV